GTLNLGCEWVLLSRSRLAPILRANRTMRRVRICNFVFTYAHLNLSCESRLLSRSRLAPTFRSDGTKRRRSISNLSFITSLLISTRRRRSAVSENRSFRLERCLLARAQPICRARESNLAIDPPLPLLEY